MIEQADYLAIWKWLLLLAQALPCCLLCMKYFHPQRRYPGALTLAAMLALVCGGCAGIARVQRVTAPIARNIALNLPTIAGIAALFLLLVAAMLLLYETTWDRVLFIAWNATLFALLLTVLRQTFRFHAPNATPLSGMGYYLICYTVAYGVLLRLADRVVLPLCEIPLPWVRRHVYLLPVSACAFLLLAQALFVPISSYKIALMITLSLAIPAAYLLCARFVLRVVAGMIDNRQFMLRVKQMEDFYVRLTQTVQQLRTYKHDMRHHFTLIGQMNRDGRRDDIEAYLAEYLASTAPDTAQRYTGNYSIDALIYHFFELARHEGIRTFAQLSLPSALHIAPYDLCSIFGNCLENALEACRQQTEGYRFIRVQGEAVGQRIVLIFSNSFNGRIRMQDQLLSTKPSDNHGYGVRSVEYSARQYGGHVKIDYTDKVFRISVLLNHSRSKAE